YWTWMALWYLNAYIVFMLVGIPLRRLHQRHPTGVLVALAAPVVISGLIGVDAIGALTSNLTFWVLGYAYHDHRHRLPSRSTALTVSAGAGAVALAYGVGVTGLGITTTASPFLNAAVGLTWVALAVA